MRELAKRGRERGEGIRTNEKTGNCLFSAAGSSSSPFPFEHLGQPRSLKTHTHTHGQTLYNKKSIYIYIYWQCPPTASPLCPVPEKARRKLRGCGLCHSVAGAGQGKGEDMEGA